MDKLSVWKRKMEKEKQQRDREAEDYNEFMKIALADLEKTGFRGPFKNEG